MILHEEVNYYILINQLKHFTTISLGFLTDDNNIPIQTY